MIEQIIGGAVVKVIEKVADWFPGKKERYRNQITKIKRELDEILSQKFTVSSYKRYMSLSDKLRKYEESIKNI